MIHICSRKQTYNSGEVHTSYQNWVGITKWTKDGGKHLSDSSAGGLFRYCGSQTKENFTVPCHRQEKQGPRWYTEMGIACKLCKILSFHPALIKSLSLNAAPRLGYHCSRQTWSSWSSFRLRQGSGVRHREDHSLWGLGRKELSALRRSEEGALRRVMHRGKEQSVTCVRIRSSSTKTADKAEKKIAEMRKAFP